MSRLISSELDRFVTALWLETGLSDNTCQAYRRDVQGLDRWLSEQRKSDALAASESDIQAYLGARLAEGSSHRSISRLLSSLRSFYQYLVREGDILADPTQHLERPKPSSPLPKSLSEAEVDRLLAAPDPAVALEYRDLAMLEVLYACGLRVSELVELLVFDPHVHVVRTSSSTLVNGLTLKNFQRFESTSPLRPQGTARWIPLNNILFLQDGAESKKLVWMSCFFAVGEDENLSHLLECE